MNKLLRRYFIFRYLIETIYFNFHYLPFRQAIHLPILLYKPHLKKCNGSIKIDTDKQKVTFGMIRLGFPSCSVYPNNGITWENKGGKVVYKGKCRIGNDSYLSFHEKTTVEFGDDFRNTAGLKLVSCKGIKFGQSTRMGWGCLIMDSNFHPLYDMKKNSFKKASGEIYIGDYNWFGTECKIMHSVKTPERCIFGMGTIVTRNCEAKSYCVMGGSPVKVLTTDVMRIIGQDTEKECF